MIDERKIRELESIVHSLDKRLTLLEKKMETSLKVGSSDPEALKPDILVKTNTILGPRALAIKILIAGYLILTAMILLRLMGYLK